MNTQTEEITESMTAEETAAPDYGTNRASYQPEDDKLRLYVGRVPRHEYEALRAEGWTSTPKQDCDFVAVWTPQREATAIRYAGIIEDEDMSPEERAADRAERFAGYRDRRTMEAVGHADRYDSGQAVHGYQDYGRAVKAADRHDRTAGRAVNSWDKAEYWQMRTAGVISHALHKCSPGVRMGRINTLEAELRRCMEAIEQGKARWNAWQRIAAISDPDEQTAAAIRYTGGCSGIDYSFKHPRPDTVSNPYYRENGTSLYSLLTCKEPITGAEACALYFGRYREPGDSTAMSRHLEMRLAYERQMLEAQGGRAEMLEILVGGKIAGRLIVKVNKSAVTGRAKSVVISGNGRNMIDLERLRPEEYTAPTAETLAELAEWKKAKKAAAPKGVSLINPTNEDAERLQALWNEAEQRRSGDKYKPAEVFRMTQAQYSAYSSGTHSSYGTITLSERMEKPRMIHGKSFDRHEVCKVRAGTSGDWHKADSVIIITDKPQKPLPFDYAEELRESEPSIESLRPRMAEIRRLVGSAYFDAKHCGEGGWQLLQDAQYAGLCRIVSWSQCEITAAGRVEFDKLRDLATV